MTVAACKKSLGSLLHCAVLAAVLALFPGWAGAAMNEKAPVDLLRIRAFPVRHPGNGKLLDVARAGSRLVAAGENGLIIVSDDSGETWSQAEVPVSVTLAALAFPTPRKGWAVGHDGVILHTSDGGGAWSVQLEGSRVNRAALDQLKMLHREKASPAPSSAAAQFDASDWANFDIFLGDMEQLEKEGSVWPFLDLWFDDDQAGFAVGAFGMAVRTRDGGKTWEPFLDRLPNAIGLHYYGIARIGADLFLAGEGGQLMRSDDDGRTWQRLESPYDGSFFGIMGTRSGGVVVAFGLRGRAFGSRDRGDTWEPLPLPQGGPWMSGSLLPDGSVLLTSPVLGGYVSRDDAQSFTAVPGFPTASTACAAAPDNGLTAVGVLGARRVRAVPADGGRAAQGADK